MKLPMDEGGWGDPGSRKQHEDNGRLSLRSGLSLYFVGVQSNELDPQRQPVTERNGTMLRGRAGGSQRPSPGSWAGFGPGRSEDLSWLGTRWKGLWEGRGQRFGGTSLSLFRGLSHRSSLMICTWVLSRAGWRTLGERGEEPGRSV